MKCEAMVKGVGGSLVFLFFVFLCCEFSICVFYLSFWEFWWGVCRRKVVRVGGRGLKGGCGKGEGGGLGV